MLSNSEFLENFCFVYLSGFDRPAGRISNQIKDGDWADNPQRHDFLNRNMSCLVAWGFNTQIGQNKKANLINNPRMS